MIDFEIPAEERDDAELRRSRIYDGPTETHVWAIARRAVRHAGDTDA